MSKTEKARQVLAEKRAKGEVGYKSRKETLQKLCVPDEIREAIIRGMVAAGNRVSADNKTIQAAGLAGLSALAYKLALEDQATALKLAIASLPKEVQIDVMVGNMSDADLLREAAEIIEYHGQGTLDSGGVEEAEIVVHESDMA